MHTHTHRMTELALEVGGEGVGAGEEQPVCRHQAVIPGVQAEAGVHTGPGSIIIIPAFHNQSLIGIFLRKLIFIKFQSNHVNQDIISSESLWI